MKKLKNFWYRICAYELDMSDPINWLIFVPPFLFVITVVILVVFRQYIVN